MGDLYLSGMLVVFIFGLLVLTFTKDEKINIDDMSLIFPLFILSLGSWFSFLLIVLTEIRSFIKKRRNK